MRLLLIRHGQTPSNVEHLLDTAVPGPGLTDLGRQQSAAIPEALSAEDVNVIFVSTLTRTQLTAEPLAQARGLPVHVRDGIREVAAGDLEMLGDLASADRYLETVLAWAGGDLELVMPGGGNGKETLGRFDEVVSEAASTGCDTAVLFSHGAAIRMWVAARANNVDPAFAAANPLGNTGVVVLEGHPESGWQALSWTDAAVGAALAGAAADGPAADPVPAPHP